MGNISNSSNGGIRRVEIIVVIVARVLVVWELSVIVVMVALEE